MTSAALSFVCLGLYSLAYRDYSQLSKDKATGKAYSTVLDEENIAAIRKNLIMLKYMPAGRGSFPEFIDPAIDKALLHSDQIEREYELYSAMRWEYEGVKFQDNPPSLFRIAIENRPCRDVRLVIQELAETSEVSTEKLEEVYKTFRSLEILRNHDNRQGQGWVESEEIISRELSIQESLS